MSMSLLTMFQFLWTLCAYLFVMLALPCAFLHKTLSRHRFMERVLLYFIIGNFYAINLVFLLQLLHISNFFTLWTGLLVIPVAIWQRRTHFPLLGRLRSLWHSGQKLLAGTLGFRNTVDSLRKKVWKLCVKLLERVGEHWLDWLLVAALVLMVMWVYGIRMLQEFGYAASDIFVHMYWVNSMKENHIFVAGIYPHGMHAVVYLLNELFGIDIYTIFRVFALVQCLTIHVVTLLVLKLCCKSRYAAYAGVFLYTIGNYTHPGSYLGTENLIRYLSTLPQETSMIYILPTVYFAIHFFQEKSRELKEFKQSEQEKAPEESKTFEDFEEFEDFEKFENFESFGELESPGELEESEKSEESEEPEESRGPKRLRSSRGVRTLRRAKKPRKAKKLKKKVPSGSSRIALAGLIMSFSLCVSAHFYGAIIAALFCIGIGIGYAGWLLRPIYFNRIVAAGLISLVSAVLPMAIAFAMGTPLQGSLNWATNIIANSAAQQQQQESEPVQAPPAQTGDTQNTEAGAAAAPAEGQNGASAVEPAPAPPKPKPWETAKRLLINLWEACGRKIENNTLRRAEVYWCSIVIRVMIVFLAAAGAVILLTPARMYGAMLLSAGSFMIILAIMYSASEIGIPTLMDTSRANLFFGYMLTVVIGFTVDGCVCIVTCLCRSYLPRDVLSFAAVLTLLTLTWQIGQIRPPLTGAGLETNEAITCLTNIIDAERDYSWTIFSANDETRMVYGHGYHYETITFLHEIERLGGKPVTVPTEKAYFFIEKNSPEYWTYGFSQEISRLGAEEAVPYGQGLSVYQGKNRWIVMSHMYYWAQEFHRLYPHEMTVYMETDNFICYRLEQNPYSLYDLAIDYGYNAVRSEGL